MFIDLLHRAIRWRYARIGFQSKRMETETCSLHFYENDSAGRSVVLLHGLGTSSSTWVHIIHLLIRKFHVVAIDLPGFGMSPLKHSKMFLTFGELSDFLKSNLSKLISTPFTLIGHSLGGWLAADFAIRNPLSLERLILIDPAGISYPEVEEQRRLFEITDLKSLYFFLSRLWWKYPWYFKPFAPAVLSDLRKRGVPLFVRSAQEGDFLNERLSGFSIPLYVIWGREDNITPHWTAEVLKSRVPETTVSYIEQCGHVPQLERPKELMRILDEVLAANAETVGPS